MQKPQPRYCWNDICDHSGAYFERIRRQLMCGTFLSFLFFNCRLLLQLMALSPFAVKSLLRNIMSNYDDCPCLPSQFKLFHTKSDRHEMYVWRGCGVANGCPAGKNKTRESCLCEFASKASSHS